MELVKYIFTIPGVKFFLSGKVTQDSLENYFGCQRQRGGRHENPNVNEFCKNSQALKVVNSICGSVSKGNCRGKKQSIDVELESRPLRKRCRAKFRDQKTYSKLIKPPRAFKSKVMSRKLKKPRKALSKAPQSVDVSICNLTTADRNDVTTRIKDKRATLDENSVTTASFTSTNTLPLTSQESLSPNNVNVRRNQQPTSEEVQIVGLDEREKQPCSYKSPVIETPSLQLEETVYSSDEDNMISKALGSGSPEEELSKCCTISIRRQDMWTLKNSEWLNDQVSKLCACTIIMFLFCYI